jgi:hypothetical protein
VSGDADDEALFHAAMEGLLDSSAVVVERPPMAAIGWSRSARATSHADAARIA